MVHSRTIRHLNFPKWPTNIWMWGTPHVSTFPLFVLHGGWLANWMLIGSWWTNCVFECVTAASFENASNWQNKNKCKETFTVMDYQSQLSSQGKFIFTAHRDELKSSDCLEGSKSIFLNKYDFTSMHGKVLCEGKDRSKERGERRGEIKHDPISRRQTHAQINSVLCKCNLVAVSSALEWAINNHFLSWCTSH